MWAVKFLNKACVNGSRNRLKQIVRSTESAIIPGNAKEIWSHRQSWGNQPESLLAEKENIHLNASSGIFPGFPHNSFVNEVFEEEKKTRKDVATLSLYGYENH